MAWMGNSKCFSAKHARPEPPAKDVLRIYSERFSAYAERVKLVLHAKNFEHETINIELLDKPNWYKEINPKEKVPAIEINGRVLHESIIISNYLDATLPGRKLTTEDPFQRALEELALDGFKEAIAGYYAFTFSDEKVESLEKMNTGVTKLLPFFENGNPFVCGDQPGMTDFMVWPFLERIWLSASSVISEQLLLQAYFDRMGENESVIACRVSGKMMTDFYRLYMEGKADCDYGLE